MEQFALALGVAIIAHLDLRPVGTNESCQLDAQKLFLLCKDIASETASQIIHLLFILNKPYLLWQHQSSARQLTAQKARSEPLS